MTTSTQPSTDARRAISKHPNPRSSTPLTLRTVLLSETVKLSTLQSFRVGLGIAVLLIISVGVIGSLVAITSDPGGDDATPDPTGGVVSGATAAMFAVAAVGVLAVTSEYASGAIHATFIAVPRRALIVLAKALVLIISVSLVLGVTTLITFLAAQMILAAGGLSISLAEPGVARAVLGTVLYLTAVAVMASGFGWLLRNSAGALASLISLLIVVPLVGFALPPAVAQVIVPYLPNNAGTAVMQLSPGDMLPPWTGFAVFSLYVAGVLAAALLTVCRREA